MVEIKSNILSSKSAVRPGGNWKKTSITIHSTANERSTAENERAWLDNKTNTRQASWHYAVDEDSIVQAIPDSEEAWHCSVTEGNRHSISIEICESGNRKKAVENAAYLTAMKINEYKLSIEDIKQHFDWSKKNCPRILRDKAYVKDNMTWDAFLDLVKKYLSGEEEKIMYKTVEDIPSWGKATIKKLMDKKYLAGDEKGNINIDDMALRVLVINDRAGLYD